MAIDNIQSLVQGVSAVFFMEKGRRFEGKILACDESTNSIAIEAADSTYAVLNLDRISHFEIVSAAPLGPLPPVVKPMSLKDILLREKKVQKEAENKFKLTGSYCSPIAKFLFKKLSKTMACSWEAEVIVVMEKGRIVPPYTENDVHCDTDVFTKRLQRIVKMERQAWESLPDSERDV
eukprot:TRINITY_DN3195_c0_g1_i1.p1 TRINITY_DN3195_c0_g1~~TRINITY_DN3195_c0_g1_i1.p1  ORF type:complete len:187 (+),score=25.29 TRINITY_DN3195_c0_g1_i1:29-562(+)